MFPPLLTIDGVRKRFGALEALRGMTFDVRRGERLALLGPNGAGKTTLIRCLSGRCRPDAGTISLGGRDLNARGVRDAIGLVPQEIAIYGDLTTRENLVAWGRCHGVTGAALRRRVDWALRWTGLDDRAGDLVGGFSGGMKRRVNLACGVLHDPTLLLLDEPTVGVDPQSRHRIFEMLDELAAGGTAIVLTTHHLDEAESRCDRIVVVDHGRVVADGTIQQLIERTVGRGRMVRLELVPSPGVVRPSVAHRDRIDAAHATASAVGLPTDPVKSDPVASDAIGPELVAPDRARNGSTANDRSGGPGRDHVMNGDGAVATAAPARVAVARTIRPQPLVPRVHHSRMNEVSRELPPLIESLRRQGYDVVDVEVETPSLHHVFLHLTGHQLRDD